MRMNIIFSARGNKSITNFLSFVKKGGTLVSQAFVRWDGSVTSETLVKILRSSYHNVLELYLLPESITIIA